MSAFGAMIGTFIGLVVLLFVGVIANTVLGGVVGWIVGLFFSDTILGVMTQLGLHNVTMTQLGLTLGFFSGFFRPMITNSKA